jgi:hypothetical protein
MNLVSHPTLPHLKTFDSAEFSSHVDIKLSLGEIRAAFTSTQPPNYEDFLISIIPAHDEFANPWVEIKMAEKLEMRVFDAETVLKWLQMASKRLSETVGLELAEIRSSGAVFVPTVQAKWELKHVYDIARFDLLSELHSKTGPDPHLGDILANSENPRDLSQFKSSVKQSLKRNLAELEQILERWGPVEHRSIFAGVLDGHDKVTIESISDQLQEVAMSLRHHALEVEELAAKVRVSESSANMG